MLCCLFKIIGEKFMIHFKRVFFIISFVFFSFFFWNFQKMPCFMQQNVHKINNHYVYDPHNIICTQRNNKFVHVQNDVISLDINLLGGNIERATLLNYNNCVNKYSPLMLLRNTKKFVYRIINGCLCKTDTYAFSRTQQPLYSVQSRTYLLQPNKNKVRVYMTWKSLDNIVYTKIISLTRGSYYIDIKFLVQNNSNHTICNSMYSEIQHTTPPLKKNSFLNNLLHLKTFSGFAWSSDDSKYQKLSLDQFQNNVKKTNIITRTGWIAMLQRHFLTAWIPDLSHQYKIYYNKLNNNIASIGCLSRVQCIRPHSCFNTQAHVWIGPLEQNQISQLSNYLNLTIDYGWLYFLANPLFRLLCYFHSFFHNWGLAIVCMTILMKILTYPLTKSQYMSTLKKEKIYFKIKKIRNEYSDSDDKSLMNQKILNVYKSQSMNPFSNIFSFCIQTPIFLSFYYILVSSVELRHAPFFLWIQDLSSYDPYYILPFFLGFSVFLIQYNEIYDDYSFKKKMLSCISPILFTIFFLWFPSGLVIYYITGNIFTFFQNWFTRFNIMQDNK